uniref:Cysteine rich secreted protein n=1 Tax=Riptortus pedestris TaxID=329032 RepID=R4WN08_RIPPE|nr:cysteine rich secreted protein [Riptortus pedestris]
MMYPALIVLALVINSVAAASVKSNCGLYRNCVFGYHCCDPIEGICCPRTLSCCNKSGVVGSCCKTSPASTNSLTLPLKMRLESQVGLNLDPPRVHH